jgi:hypothetical protein
MCRGLNWTWYCMPVQVNERNKAHEHCSPKPIVLFAVIECHDVVASQSSSYARFILKHSALRAKAVDNSTIYSYIAASLLG